MIQGMKSLLYTLCFTLCTLAALPAQAQLDPSFGDGGKVIANIDNTQNTPGEFDCLTVLPNGKIIGAGGCYGGRLMMRFLDNGVTDSSFATNGIAIDSFGGNGVAAMVVLSNSKLLAFSHYWERFLPNGIKDSSFGINGRVTPLFGGYPALQNDQKIVLASVSQNIIQLARYYPDGSIDSGFGVNGVVYTNFNGPNAGNYNNITISSILIQPDGKIVISGDSKVTAISAYAFIALRYNTDGSLDTSFNHTGKAYTYVGGLPFGRDLLLQPDGKILQCGMGGLGIVLVRYNTDGSLDTSFDHTGIYSINGDWHECHRMALMPDGRIITAGTTDTNQCSLYRILPNGGIDSSFGTNGRVLTFLDSISTANPSWVNALHLYNDGRILIGGQLVGNTTGTRPFLIRYLPNGHPTGIVQLAPNTQQLQIYPNPADKFVTIVPPTVAANLTVTDISGHNFLETMISGQPLQLDISGFIPGLYFITIKTTTGQIFHARFLKK